MELAKVVRVGSQIPFIDGFHLGSMTGGFIGLDKMGRGHPREEEEPWAEFKIPWHWPHGTLETRIKAWAAQVPSHRTSMAGKHRAGNSVE